MERQVNKYVKRTQKDYSMSFKMSVVREYEDSCISLKELTRKYGIQGNQKVRNGLFSRLPIATLR